MEVDTDQTPKRKTQRNRRGEEPTDTPDADTSLLESFYMTARVGLKPSSEILNALREKLVALVEIAQEADPTAVFVPCNPDVTGSPIRKPDDVPTTFTSILKYFDTTSKLQSKGGTMWCTTKIALSGDLEDLLNRTSYDLERQGISLTKKRLQLFKTSTPGYMQFIKNTLDTDDVGLSIRKDLVKAQAKEDDVPQFVIYNKEPWTGYKKERKGRKQAQWSRAFHFETDRDEKSSLESQVRHWIKSGAAKKRFGENIRYIEAVHAKTSANQRERTQRMNLQGQRFQASVATTILVGLVNPDRVLTVRNEKSRRNPLSKTVRELILERTTKDGQPIFLSVTKKWNSSDFEGAYATKQEDAATDFAECPCAFLRFELGDTIDTQELYKAFDNEAVAEAGTATWDKNNARAITAKEQEDNADIEAAASTKWFVDLSAVQAPEETGVTDRPVQAERTNTDLEFNWNDGCSIDTCRTTGTVGTTPSNHLNPRVVPNHLTPSSGATSTSDQTTESRLDSLESKLTRVLAALERGTPQSAVHGVANPSGSAPGEPTSLNGEVGL